MNIARQAVAGTLESSDIMLEVFPHEKGVEIELTSTVINQYGDDIRAAIADTVAGQGVDSVRIRATDRGALECVIRARTETAILRALKGDGQ